jgi:hypothetical protein
VSHRLPLADIRFISDFAAFCRTKGDETYNYSDNWNCACAQFLIASGRAKSPCVGGIGYARWLDEAASDSARDFPAGMAEALYNRDTGHTFSALADRLEALIVDAPGVSS